jgi:hypothetical protein
VEENEYYRLVFPFNKTPFCLVDNQMALRFLGEFFPNAIDFSIEDPNPLFILNNQVVTEEQYRKYILKEETKEILKEILNEV